MGIKYANETYAMENREIYHVFYHSHEPVYKAEWCSNSLSYRLLSPNANKHKRQSKPISQKVRKINIRCLRSN